MALEQYLKSKKDGEQLNDTLFHKVVEGYIAASKHFYNEEGVIDRTKIEKKDIQENAGSDFYNSLKEFVIEHYGASTTNETRIRNLIYGTFGVRQEHLTKYFKDTESDASLMDLITKMQRNQVGIFGYLLGQNASEAPKSALAIEDAGDVIKHTHTDDKINPDKLTIETMAELLDEYEEKHSITDHFLKGKDYALKKK